TTAAARSSRWRKAIRARRPSRKRSRPGGSNSLRSVEAAVGSVMKQRWYLLVLFAIFAIGLRVSDGAAQSSENQAPQPRPASAAQRAVLYEEDPGDPLGKRYDGSVVWRAEVVTSAPDGRVVRADIEVPERHFAMNFSFRRNDDKSLPASHTIELTFKLP